MEGVRRWVGGRGQPFLKDGLKVRPLTAACEDLTTDFARIVSREQPLAPKQRHRESGRARAHAQSQQAGGRAAREPEPCDTAPSCK